MDTKPIVNEIDVDALQWEDILAARMVRTPAIIKKVAESLDMSKIQSMSWSKRLIEDLIKLHDEHPEECNSVRVKEIAKLSIPTYEKKEFLSAIETSKELDDRADLYALETVLHKHYRHDVFKLMMEIDKSLRDTRSVTELATRVEAAVDRTDISTAYSIQEAPTVDRELSESLVELEEDLEDGEDRRIKTGIHTIDDILTIEERSMTAIAARPSNGKTSVCLRLAYEISQLGYQTSVITLEVTKRRLKRQLGTMIAGLNAYEVKRNASGRVRSMLSEAYEKFSIPELEIQSEFSDITEIANYIERSALRRVKPVKVFFIDYFQIIDVQNKKFGEKEKLDFISEKIRNLKRKYPIAIFMAAQLNRTAEDRAPTISQLKGTGNVEQDCDNVLLLHRPKKHAAEQNLLSGGKEIEDDEIDIVIGKQRFGATGSRKFRWIGPKTWFEEFTNDELKERTKKESDREKKSWHYEKKDSGSSAYREKFDDVDDGMEGDDPF